MRGRRIRRRIGTRHRDTRGRTRGSAVGRGRARRRTRGPTVRHGRARRRTRVPHGRVGGRRRNHRAHPALLPRARSDPPPRREGRIAWYDEQHLARLRTIAALLERGHTLNGIADLTTAFESGRNVREVLALGAPSEEEPVRLTPEELADHFAGEVTPENLAAALDLGYLVTDGEEIIHISRRLLDVSAALVREGVPLAEVLKAGARVREHADALAELFTDLLRTHAAEDDLWRLRPLAKSVVEAELSMALDRRLHREGPAEPAS